MSSRCCERVGEGCLGWNGVEMRKKDGYFFPHLLNIVITRHFSNFSLHSTHPCPEFSIPSRTWIPSLGPHRQDSPPKASPVPPPPPVVADWSVGTWLVIPKMLQYGERGQHAQLPGPRR